MKLDRELCTVLVLDIKLGSKLGPVLDNKLDFKLGTVLERRHRTVVVLDINLGTVQVDIKVDSKLGTVLDRRHCTEVVLDINLGSELGTVFDRGPILVDIKLELKS
jgi:hypothetical protein